MVSLLFFLKSWLIGISIAVPIGPIGILCIRRAMEYGIIGALNVGIGAAIADGIYSVIATFGISKISNFLIKHSSYLKIVGGSFLLYIAFRELKKSIKDIKETSENKFFIVLQVLLLKFTNPITAIVFIGLFPVIIGIPSSFKDSFSIVLGVFLGSMTWWIILGKIVTKMNNNIPFAWVQKIKYSSSIILGAIGVITLIIGLIGLF